MKNNELLEIIEWGNKNKGQLTHISDKSKLSTDEKFKIALCKHFVQFVNMKRIKLKEFSELTGIPVTRLSEITNYKIQKFTVDQLLKNLSILAQEDKATQAYLNFLEAALLVPTLKVSETRKLTKTLLEI